MKYLDILDWAEKGIRHEINKAAEMHRNAVKADNKMAINAAQGYIDSLEIKLDTLHELMDIHNRND